MTTFSQLVDELILETKRPDLASEIRSYVNQTIRELHFRPDNGAAILYRDNLKELAVVANVDLGFSWTLPNYEVFQHLQAVQFANVGCGINGRGTYIEERKPGRSLALITEFWYRAGNYIVFQGYGGINSTINLAYYEYPMRLPYFALALRPAQWDSVQGWTYTDAIVTDEDKLAAQKATSNWILLRWTDLVMEGTRAKVYKRTSDDSRAKMSYSLFTQMRMGIFTSETMEQGMY